MPRTPRLHRLEPAEKEHVNADLRLIREKIKTIYTAAYPTTMLPKRNGVFTPSQCFGSAAYLELRWNSNVWGELAFFLKKTS